MSVVASEKSLKSPEGVLPYYWRDSGGGGRQDCGVRCFAFYGTRGVLRLSRKKGTTISA